jgi:translation elongation factor EF-4
MSTVLCSLTYRSDVLILLIHSDRASQLGRQLAQKLKDLIDRQVRHLVNTLVYILYHYYNV